MHRLRTCLTVVVLLFSVNLYAPVHPIQTISVLAEFFAKVYELSRLGPVLVVFDIDKVLLLGRWDDGDDSQSTDSGGLSMPQPPSRTVLVGGGGTVAGAAGGTPIMLNKIQRPQRKHAMPRRLVIWLRDLTQAADVICLTSRQPWSKAQLDQKGVFLGGIENMIELDPGQLGVLENQHHSTYDSNVIYTAHNPKGAPLAYFAGLSETAYTSVIFIDDQLGNVQNVVEALEAAGMNVWGFHFTGTTLGQNNNWQEPDEKDKKDSDGPFFHKEPSDD